MSRAHQESRLVLYGMPNAVDMNMKELFHYDISPNGVNGTHPVDELYDDSLMMWLDMGELNSDKTYVVDKSRYGNHAIIGGATVVPGRNGKALGFTTDDYLDTIGDFNPGPNFSIEMWIFPNTSANNQCFIGKHKSNGDNILLFGYWGDSYEICVYDVNVLYAVDAYASGSWQHLVVTFQKSGSNTISKLYRNGILLTTGTHTGKTFDVMEGKAWTIGQDWDGDSRSDFFNGTIDQVRIYNRILSPAEVLTRYNESIYSIRSEGMYGGALAIEKGTVNLISKAGSDAQFDTFTGWSYSNPYSSAILMDSPEATIGTKIVKYVDIDGDTTNNRWDGISMSGTTQDSPAGSKWTFTMRFKVLNYTTGTIAIWSHSVGLDTVAGTTTDIPADIGIPSALFQDGQWHVFTTTVTTPSAATYPNVPQWHKTFKPGFNKTNLGCELYIDYVQMETGDIPTSFVNGARVDGNLLYSNPLVKYTGDFTVSVWADITYSRNGTTGNDTLLSIDNGTDGVSLFGIDYDNANGQLRFFVYNDSNVSSIAQVSIARSGWKCITAVKTSSSLTLYVNGMVVASASFAGTYTMGSNLLIGSRIGKLSEGNLLIDELRIDKIARTAEEILAWYVSDCPHYPRGAERVVL